MKYRDEMLEFIRKFDNHIDFNWNRMVQIYNEVFNQNQSVKGACYTCKKRIIKEFKEYLNNGE